MSELQITDRILASDTLGRYIRVREWLPANGISRGDALVLHGLGDHIARHDWAAGLLARAGYRAIGFDWPGNGKSDGVRGDMPTVPETGLFLEEMLEKLPCDPIGIFPIVKAIAESDSSAQCKSGDPLDETACQRDFPLWLSVGGDEEGRTQPDPFETGEGISPPTEPVRHLPLPKANNSSAQASKWPRSGRQ